LEKPPTIRVFRTIRGRLGKCALIGQFKQYLEFMIELKGGQSKTSVSQQIFVAWLRFKLGLAIHAQLQTNGVDCGCHALIMAENISRRSLNFDFQTKEINSYREKMAFEKIDGKLLDQKLCADF
jgi:hypothetical protein